MNKACWMTIADPADPKQKKALDEFIRLKQEYVYFDKDHNPVYMAETSWALNVAIENNPDIHFHTTSEFKTEGVGA